MKKTIASLLGMGLLAITSVAQLNVEITDEDGNLQNEGTYVVYDDPSTPTMHLDLISKNLSSANIVVNVKRYETGVQSGTQNFFCWGLCYGEVDAGAVPVWVSDDFVDMIPDSSYVSFHAYHKPLNLAGVSCYRYVWYDTGNVNDSTWVDICFDTETVGISESNVISELNVYPNPSLGSVNFDIALDASTENAELVIHNLLGARVWSKTIWNNEQKIVLNEGELTPGIYFYSVQVNGQIAITEKLIIAQQ